MVTSNSHLSLDYFYCGSGSFDIGRPMSRRWMNFGCRWTRGVRGWGGLENWTIFMDVILPYFVVQKKHTHTKTLRNK